MSRFLSSSSEESDASEESDSSEESGASEESKESSGERYDNGRSVRQRGTTALQQSHDNHQSQNTRAGSIDSSSSSDNDYNSGQEHILVTMKMAMHHFTCKLQYL